MGTRTFLALDIDDALRRALARVVAAMDFGDAKAKLVAPENLHVTLQFLGDVGDQVLPDVCRVTGEVAAAHTAIEFDVSGLRAIGSRGSLRMVWAEVSDPRGAMTQLYAGLAEALAELGFAPDRRPFRGHITLARIKACRPNSADAIRRSTGAVSVADFPPQRAEHITVYASELTPRGPVYTACTRAPFLA